MNNKNTSIKREVVNELHRPARRNFKRRRVIIRGLNDLFQADLVEMIPYAKINRNYRYILIVINTFSKFVWAFPIKRKSGKEVTEAISKIFTRRQNVPKNLQTDLGKEFYNREFQDLMKKYKINHYSTFSNVKASIVERVNRTLKNMMWKEFSFQGNYKWLSLLPEIVHKYNTTKHHTTAMKPIDINNKNEKEVLKNVYSHIKVVDPKINKFKVGDFVRISKYREAFEKGYTPNWSNEIFKVIKIKSTNPTTYYITDSRNQEIKGGFYEYELQKVKYPDIYLVEKVLRRKGDKVYVKWLGLNSTHNSWISKNNVA